MKNINNMNIVHRRSTLAKPLIGTSASTSCSSFSLSAEHSHATISHNVGIFNIASVYCWYLQHPARVASFGSSEHDDDLGDIDAVVHIYVQIRAKLAMANLIESGQNGDKLINRCWYSWCWCANLKLLLSWPTLPTLANSGDVGSRRRQLFRKYGSPPPPPSSPTDQNVHFPQKISWIFSTVWI